MKSQVDIEFFIAITIFAITIILVTKGLTDMLLSRTQEYGGECELVLIREDVGKLCDENKCIYVEGKFVKFVGKMDECWYGDYKVISSNITIEENGNEICMYGEGTVELLIDSVLYKQAHALSFKENGPFIVGC